MKYTRLLVALLVAAFSLWVIVGEQMSGVSANAFVNGQVVTIRSERAGTLKISERSLGSFVSEGEVLASVFDPLVDSIRLNDLEFETERKAAEISWIELTLDTLKETRDGLRKRSKVFQARRIAEAQIQLDRARNRLMILEDQGDLHLSQVQIADAVNWATGRLPGEPIIYELALEHAQERVEVLENTLAAAKSGVFLGDGYNDSPNSEQHYFQLGVEIQNRIAALRQAKDMQKALKKRLARERLRVEKLQSGELRAPVTGVYWEVIAANQVNVQRGDPVLRLVDCSSTMVSLSVSEMVYNSLKLGGEASFRFMNESRVFKGTITRLAGSGANRIYDSLAVVPSLRHLERFDVTIVVPELSEDPELACSIGRTGRVFFEVRPLDTLRAMFN
jgi:multidrug resistance efflux pump